MGKKENLRFELFKNAPQLQKEGKESKIIKEVAKMQFMNEEDCKEFESILKNYFGQ